MQHLCRHPASARCAAAATAAAVAAAGPKCVLHRWVAQQRPGGASLAVADEKVQQGLAQALDGVRRQLLKVALHLRPRTRNRDDHADTHTLRGEGPRCAQRARAAERAAPSSTGTGVVFWRAAGKPAEDMGRANSATHAASVTVSQVEVSPINEVQGWSMRACSVSCQKRLCRNDAQSWRSSAVRCTGSCRPLCHNTTIVVVAWGGDRGRW